jgi:hypothetical protein
VNALDALISKYDLGEQAQGLERDHGDRMPAQLRQSLAA